MAKSGGFCGEGSSLVEWSSLYGPHSYVLACKLKALKGDLKYWNKHVFEDVSFRKKCLLTKLLDLDVKEGM